MKPPLHDLNFIKLLSSRALALLANGVTTIAFAFLAFHLRGRDAASIMAIILSLKMLTYIFLAPLLELYCRRISRKTLLIFADCARAICMLAYVWVSQLWQVYLLAIVFYLFSAMSTPSYQSVVADLFPDHTNFIKAQSMMKLVYIVETLLAPLFASLLLLLWSVHHLFIVNALLFLIAGVIIYFCRIPAVKFNVLDVSIAGLKDFTQSVAGIKYLFTLAEFRINIVLLMISTFAGAMVYVNSVHYVQTLFLATHQLTAFAYAAFGAGVVLAALLMTRLIHKKNLRFMWIGAAIVMIAELLAAIHFNLSTLLLCWFLFGIASLFVENINALLVTKAAQHAANKSLFAANFSLTHVLWLLGYAFAGFVAAPLTPGLSFSLLLLFSLLLVVVAMK